MIKTSEIVLEDYAQKKSIPMEIELGATDLFSFEPVDSYLRPLRLNNYITEESFIKKYSLHSSKIDKDDSYEAKSI